MAKSLHSMTGFSSARGEMAPFSWAWELRSVNAKGLSLNLRIPDWLEGLEASLRAELGKVLGRGSVTLTLRIGRDEEKTALVLNESAMNNVLEALATLENEALERGVTLAPSRASDLLALRGVMETGAGDRDPAPLVAQLKQDFPSLLDGFLEMRRNEGAQLVSVLSAQLDEIEELTAKAAQLAGERREAVARALSENLARVMEYAREADPDRVAQELALIAVKADVTEELDRLGAHVRAAQDLLAKGGPVGRKLDFLMQEFNREANTLCSKSQSSDLTAVGLELKAVIDQMREQVQNVE